MRTNVLVAVGGVAIFTLLMLASGRIDVRNGLGWDGAAYARMVTGSWQEGSPNTMLRPVVVLAARIPYAAGLGVIPAFQLINVLSAFALYLTVCLLLARHGVSLPIRAIIVANLALSVSTAKLFAFYPVLVDFAALAITTVAFYLAGTERRWATSAACALAVGSREFGLAAVLYGIHRSVRLRRSWREITAVYLPSLVVLAAVRVLVTRSHGGGVGPLSVADALDNLGNLGSPAFVIVFVYFTMSLFGGISMLLAVRPGWCIRRFRDEPELATFVLPIVGLSVVAALDIWRYLAFCLPVAVVLVARMFGEWNEMLTRRIAAVMTLATVVTQRPFEHMNVPIYFREWFPLYEYAQGANDELIKVWVSRVLCLALLTFATWLVARGSEPRGNASAAEQAA